eukprot:537316_1
MAALLKQKLISRHCELISEIETKYMNHINQLLQQKRKIICKMQQEFYAELEKLNHLCNPFIKNEYNNYNESYNTQSSNKTNSSRIETESHNFITEKKQLDNKLNGQGNNAIIASNQSKLSNNNRKEIVAETDKIKIINTRNSLKKFKCSKCNFSTKWKSSLKTHILTHSKRKSFKCNRCNGAFKTQSGLCQHKRIHSRKRPYKCGQCKKGFKHKNVLIAHIQSHSGNKPYKCKKCKKPFTTIIARNKHCTLQVCVTNRSRKC